MENAKELCEEAIRRMEVARDKDKIAEYPYNRCIDILREVFKDEICGVTRDSGDV